MMPTRAPTDTAVILGRIEASEKNTKDRIEDSNRHTSAIIDTHEVNDQKRFDEQAALLVAHEQREGKALREHDRYLGSKLDSLTKQVEVTNGGLAEVTGDVAVIKRRDAQLAERRIRRITFKQGLIVAVSGALAGSFGLLLARVLFG
jgi:hypothetical protein